VKLPVPDGVDSGADMVPEADTMGADPDPVTEGATTGADPVTEGAAATDDLAGIAREELSPGIAVPCDGTAAALEGRAEATSDFTAVPDSSAEDTPREGLGRPDEMGATADDAPGPLTEGTPDSFIEDTPVPEGLGTPIGGKVGSLDGLISLECAGGR